MINTNKIINNIIGKKRKLRQESEILENACPKCKGSIEYCGVNLFGLHEYHCLECDNYWGTPAKLTGDEKWE